MKVKQPALQSVRIPLFSPRDQTLLTRSICFPQGLPAQAGSASERPVRVSVVVPDRDGVAGNAGCGTKPPGFELQVRLLTGGMTWAVPHPLAPSDLSCEMGRSHRLPLGTVFRIR